MMTTDFRGLYIHVPFCIRKCNYCDFASYSSVSSELREKYIDSLISEIGEYNGEGISLDTVFFGGGTPSLLSPSELSRIVDAMSRSFSLCSDTEFSMEVNPKTVTADKMRAFRSLGLNRVSIGMQSAKDSELSLLGRVHTYADFLDSYRTVRNAGIDNVNIDLMYGIPGQTEKSFSETLDEVISLSPEHISAYGLILEEGTDFYKRKNELSLPGEDEECNMYNIAAERLSDYGYLHYEISNYAKDGFSCRHNLKYWRDEEYIGIGLAAHSYYKNRRYGNPCDFSEYFSRPVKKYLCEEELTPADEAYEYAMMRLRLSEGFSLFDYESRFSTPFLDGREREIKRFSELGLLSVKDGRISLTEKGFYLSNTILSGIL